MIWSTTNPFSEIRRLQSQMNRLFDDYRNEDDFPAVNMYGNEEQIVLTAELPGIDPKDLNLNVVQNQISLEGERKPYQPTTEVTYHRRERGCGKFFRSFRLPFDIDRDNVKADYKNGILTITMERAEETKPRKITINS
jgi:HSP20 family protein